MLSVDVGVGGMWTCKGVNIDIGVRCRLWAWVSGNDVGVDFSGCGCWACLSVCGCGSRCKYEACVVGVVVWLRRGCGRWARSRSRKV